MDTVSGRGPVSRTGLIQGFQPDLREATSDRRGSGPRLGITRQAVADRLRAAERIGDRASDGTVDALTLWGLLAGGFGALLILIAVALMAFGFNPKSRRYPNPGALQSSGWANYLGDLQRVNLILLAGSAFQLLSIVMLAAAAIDP